MQDLNLFSIYTDILNSNKLKYFITGSVAAIVYGEPRLTEKTLVRAKAWFKDNFNCNAGTYLYEQCIAMPNYNSVMVLFTLSDFL
jgi:hypothetical protein